jgi:hypothetical protein
MNERKASIELASLPLTIRGSIIVARKLGGVFIWVDAMCTIQDDNDDWEREAAQMEHVYGNAELTITTASASSADEGFINVAN